MKDVLGRLVWVWRLLRTKSYVIITDDMADMHTNVRSPFLAEDKLQLEEQRDILKFYQTSFQHVIDEFEAQVKTYGEEQANRSIT